MKLNGDYNFNNLHNSVWNYYADEMDLGLSRSTHSMSLLLGKYGPRAKDTAELGGKKNLLVCFEKVRYCMRSSLVHYLRFTLLGCS